MSLITKNIPIVLVALLTFGFISSLPGAAKAQETYITSGFDLLQGGTPSHPSHQRLHEQYIANNTVYSDLSNFNDIQLEYLLREQMLPTYETTVYSSGQTVTRTISPAVPVCSHFLVYGDCRWTGLYQELDSNNMPTGVSLNGGNGSLFSGNTGGNTGNYYSPGTPHSGSGGNANKAYQFNPTFAANTAPDKAYNYDPRVPAAAGRTSGSGGLFGSSVSLNDMLGANAGSLASSLTGGFDPSQLTNSISQGVTDFATNSANDALSDITNGAIDDIGDIGSITANVNLDGFDPDALAEEIIANSVDDISPEELQAQLDQAARDYVTDQVNNQLGNATGNFVNNYGDLDDITANVNFGGLNPSQLSQNTVNAMMGGYNAGINNLSGNITGMVNAGGTVNEFSQSVDDAISNATQPMDSYFTGFNGN